MSKKSHIDMYQELLNQQDIFDPDDGLSSILNPKLKGYRDNEDDVEEFLTSKEIVKTKKKLEEITGISPDDGIIEEEVHFKRYSKRREYKYTETEMAEIRNSCYRTIVHDYGEYDIYHVSDEERSRNDQLAEINLKLGGLKRIYHRVDQYIEAMRVVFQAWGILERANFIHTKDEFFGMVAEGRIVSNRIIMPKLKKMDRYNIDMIINYISNPELDPSHLVPQKQSIVEHDPFYDDDDLYGDRDIEAEETARLLSEEEVKYILENIDDPKEFEVGYIKPKYIRGYDRRTFKGRKKEGKKNKYFRENLADILNKIQNGQHYKSHGSSHMITHSLFEPEKKQKSFWDDLYFDGSWANDDDLMVYDMVIMEEFLKQSPLKEPYLTYNEKYLEKFFSILEENGMNTVDLRTKMGQTEDSLTKKKDQATKKENKKIESALIQRITKLNKSPKFKKIVKKAEDALEKHTEGEY